MLSKTGLAFPASGAKNGLRPGPIIVKSITVAALRPAAGVSRWLASVHGWLRCKVLLWSHRFHAISCITKTLKFLNR